VRPAAFHANAIVMVECGFVGVDGVWVAGADVEVAELRRDFAHAARSCRSRARIRYGKRFGSTVPWRIHNILLDGQQLKKDTEYLQAVTGAPQRHTEIRNRVHYIFIARRLHHDLQSLVKWLY